MAHCTWLDGPDSLIDEDVYFSELCEWLSTDDLIQILEHIEGGEYSTAQYDAVAKALGYEVNAVRMMQAEKRFRESVSQVLQGSLENVPDHATHMEDMRIVDALNSL